jgi:uncharacterized protein YcbK (DUF882 family)
MRLPRFIPFFTAVLIMLALVTMIALRFAHASTHFKQSEFACHCCNRVILSPELVLRLEQLRNKLGCPITITSGYRCPKHNKFVGGVRNSQHVRGCAADIKVSTLAPSAVAKAARACGFGFVKQYKTFCHVDCRQRL